MQVNTKCHKTKKKRMKIANIFTNKINWMEEKNDDSEKKKTKIALFYCNLTSSFCKTPKTKREKKTIKQPNKTNRKMFTK